ncbi:Pam17-domain-containing protein [Xylariaceae sp. FL0255]|nr:Pam17-domain-containing protein [Xylariaceae sp. FL0255]
MLTPTATVTTARLASVLAVGSRQTASAFARSGATCPYSSLTSSFARQTCTARAAKFPAVKVIFPTTAGAAIRKPASASLSSQYQFTARRHASTTTAPPSSSASAGPSASSTSSPKTEKSLDWNTFFQLRKTRRRFQLGCSVVTMFAGAATGAIMLVSTDMDWLLTKVPMDPIFALGIITLSFAGLGWLAGPSLGSAIFYLAKRGVKRPMAAKESEFFNRIRKNRVDPSNSSLSGNAVPDFYGEKISSVAGYRQWLKDQRAFNKKRTSFV